MYIKSGVTIHLQKQGGRQMGLSRKSEKRSNIQYMDLKYISECVQLERRHVRLKIFEYRRNRPTTKDYGHALSRIKDNVAIKRSFYRYAALTRLYRKMYKAYLAEMKKNP